MIRNATPVRGYSTALSQNNFNVLLYGNDGKENHCTGTDGFLKIALSGSMTNTMKWGFTLVGTISPVLSLEEAYGYFDSDLFMSGTLDFDGKGKVSFKYAERTIVYSPIKGYEFSHPGNISYSPSLNADISLIASGEIDG